MPLTIRATIAPAVLQSILRALFLRRLDGKTTADADADAEPDTTLP